jgi:uncharacterized protein YuzE
MKIKYFKDTDTVLVEFQNKKVFETKAINDDIILDLDEFGSLITMTIEHAHSQTGLPFLSFEQIDKEFPQDSLICTT